MADQSNRPGPGRPTTDLAGQVGHRVRRKQNARKKSRHAAWFGLGMFGLVGWSVAIPTLAGIAIGLWMDDRWPGNVSWTLTLLIIGIALGCINAWYWIKQESDQEDHQESDRERSQENDHD